MKIRTAIFLVYMVASALGFAVLMRFVLSEVRPRYVSALQRNLDESARLLAAALNQPAELPEGLPSMRSGLRLRLVDEAGAVVFDNQSAVDEPPVGYETDSGRGLAKRISSNLLNEKPVNEGTEVRAEAPLTLHNGRSGRLVLSRSIRSVNAVIWSERKKLAGMAILIAGVMLVAGWWIAARLTHSLERLTAYVQAVRDDRRVSPPASRAREIASLAKAFEEMRDSLEGRQHLERYTQALTHEVKAPLAAIRGAAELLDEDMPAPQRAKFLANIRIESARIQRIIERLLELSSLEARKTLQQTELLPAGQLASDAVEAVRAACSSRNIDLVVQAGPADLRVCGEAVLLREALVNLLQNAIEFSPSGGSVRLGWAREASVVNFWVEDEGPGVPDYALSRVFERFYSLARPGTDKKSTGLGLALVREIAHLHDGEVRLVNRAGGGACATLHLPMA